jgi:hypothetical protein
MQQLVACTEFFIVQCFRRLVGKIVRDYFIFSCLRLDGSIAHRNKVVTVSWFWLWWFVPTQFCETAVGRLQWSLTAAEKNDECARRQYCTVQQHCSTIESQLLRYRIHSRSTHASTARTIRQTSGHFFDGEAKRYVMLYTVECHSHDRQIKGCHTQDRIAESGL